MLRQQLERKEMSRIFSKDLLAHCHLLEREQLTLSLLAVAHDESHGILFFFSILNLFKTKIFQGNMNKQTNKQNADSVC